MTTSNIESRLSKLETSIAGQTKPLAFSVIFRAPLEGVYGGETVGGRTTYIGGNRNGETIHWEGPDMPAVGTEYADD